MLSWHVACPNANHPFFGLERSTGDCFPERRSAPLRLPTLSQHQVAIGSRLGQSMVPGTDVLPLNDSRRGLIQKGTVTGLM
jgi:hypothetical protein